jgi:hypothetical protein
LAKVNGIWGAERRTGDNQIRITIMYMRQECGGKKSMANETRQMTAMHYRVASAPSCGWQVGAVG